jgi:trimeric autotransporter adhesin
VGDDLPADATRYEHTVPLWTRLLANYQLRACNAAGCTASATQSWSVALMNGSIGYVKASNSQANDIFGSAVALSADGTTLAVAARQEDGGVAGIDGNGADNSLSSSGAVYVYARQGGQWTLQAYLKASNPDAGDSFGSGISLSADGNTLAVGAPGEESDAIGVNGNQLSNAAPGAGAVYVFERGNAGWAQSSYLKATNTASSAYFGIAVALSGDGSTLLVGASGDDGNATGVNGVPADYTATDSGAAYVYRRTATSWVIQAYLKSNQADTSDFFGGAVAISHDGNRVAVAAAQEDGGATGVGGFVDNAASGAGAVFLFTRSGNDWSNEAYVKASNTAAGDQFGHALALSGDGSILVVGAPQEDSGSVGSTNGDQDDNTQPDSGAVYVFGLQGALWSQYAYIKASNTAATSNFGAAVAVSFDGQQLALGAVAESNSGLGFGGNPYEDDALAAKSGAVYMLDRVSNAWQIRRYVKAGNANAQDDFGDGLALSADGSTMAVGAIREDSAATGLGGNPNDASASGAGAVYLY